VDTLSYKTKSANAQTVNKQWLLVDVADLPLGRAATAIATLLRGKHKPSFTPHVDCGDNVVVINASKIQLSGNKWEQKEYIRHTGYPGGQRVLTATQVHAKDATRLVEKAVKGMLPKNKLGADLFRNLRVYADANHNQEGQQPQAININDRI
jgi:large subunit ribosomal protein L13